MSDKNLRHRPYKVTFLIDKSNDWILYHLKQSDKFISDNKFTFRISHEPKEIFDQDIVFILGYTKILDKDFITKNKLNLVIHESDLPQGKGFAPVQWQILENKNEISICLIEAIEDVDSGDIVFKSSFTLDGYELYDEIRLKQAAGTFDTVFNFLIVYPNFTRIKQSGKTTFYPKRGRKDGKINIEKSLREQFNLLRIGNNEEWPSFFCIDGHEYVLKIFKLK